MGRLKGRLNLPNKKIEEVIDQNQKFLTEKGIVLEDLKGFGSFGYVFGTKNNHKVIKISKDPNEYRFFNLAVKEQKYSIFPKIYELNYF